MSTYETKRKRKRKERERMKVCNSQLKIAYGPGNENSPLAGP